MKKETILLSISLLLFGFMPYENSAQKHYQQGMENLKNEDYINAIAEFTHAISLEPSFADAYFQRAVSKDLLGQEAGFVSTELCYDLIQAQMLGNDNSLTMLLEKSQTECFTTQNAFLEPDMVFCADFSSSRLNEMPSQSASLSVLLHLNLYDNNITSIPPVINDYQYLVALNLASNKLQSINQSLTKLSWLVELNLSKNQLSSLSSNLCNFPKLKFMNLRNNNIEAISNEISNLNSLEVLDLALNNIKDLPESLYSMTHLKELVLVGNPLDPSKVKELQKALPNTKVYFN
ncbi:leucine-rich repeat domain-containing protein [Flammeovirgaceae bacterium SG7u.111]|nr:leucine-rich repeat domain-containing protein [Flammeovirgaceae bacterium SG7u.132]WPO35983.1 leucine-rich repeat domain-containing protein [Flammeovirgaceae bacterium SG7u.111]